MATTANSTAFVPRSKDTSTLRQVVQPIPFSKLSEILLSTAPAPSPQQIGKVSLIVERPSVNARNIVNTTTLSQERGMENSGWVKNPERGLVDQICVMSTTAIRNITGGEDIEAWAAAGDQFFFDYDLSSDNLRIGDTVKVGDCVLRVSPKPHTGCGKFAKRFGVDALKIVATPLGKERRLRGIYFEVVHGGCIRTGDTIVKLASEGTD